jgi:hypothetical protein
MEDGQFAKGRCCGVSLDNRHFTPFMLTNETAIRPSVAEFHFKYHITVGKVTHGAPPSSTSPS